MQKLVAKAKIRSTPKANLIKRFKRYVLMAMGVGIILYILAQIDLKELLSIFRDANINLLVIGFFISVVSPVLNAIKWKVLLSFKGVNIPTHQVVANQMIGLFISSFLPSRYSGDIYRAYVVAKYSGKGYDSAASVIMQRLSGLFTLVLICIFSAGYSLLDPQLVQLAGTIIIACSVVMIALVTVLTPRLYSIFDNILGLVRLTRLRNYSANLYTSIVAYRNEKRLILTILMISCAFYLFSFVTVYIIGLTVDSKVSFNYIMLVVPMIYLLEALPISVNGLGIREGAFVFFFTRAGLQVEQAFAISVIILFYRILKTLIGGLLFILKQSDFKLLNQMNKNRMTSNL